MIYFVGSNNRLIGSINSMNGKLAKVRCFKYQHRHGKLSIQEEIQRALEIHIHPFFQFRIMMINFIEYLNMHDKNNWRKNISE